MSKISRGKKGEEKVKTLITKKIKGYHRLLNDITFVNENSEMTHQIDHILIHPYGVFVIETKNYYGNIIADTGDVFWLKENKGKLERISDPLKQNKSHTKMVKRQLDKSVDVIPVVVFVKNNAPIVGDENVINYKDFNLFIESYPYSREMDKKEIDEIYKTLKSSSTKVSKKEHLENIGYLKQIRKENQDEIEYAATTRICPRCDSPMIVNGTNYRCSKCNFKFKF